MEGPTCEFGRIGGLRHTPQSLAPTPFIPPLQDLPPTMKLERLHEYLTTTVVMTVGIGLALYCGKMTGSGQMKMVGLIGTAAFVTALCITLRTRIWLIIPLCWGLIGRIPVTELPFSVRDMAIGVTFGAYLIFYALKLLRTKPSFDLLDFFVILNLVNLVTVFLRNPVGVDWLGSEKVGGRPYFDICMGVVAFWLLSRAPADVLAARIMPIVLLIGSAFVSLGSLLLTVFPASGRFLGLIYSNFAPPDAATAAMMAQDQIGRKPELAGVGASGMQVFCAYFRPITLVSPFHPLRLLGSVLFLLAILFSGFRSALVTVAVYMVISAYYRKTLRDIVVFGLLGVLAITVMAAGNNRIFTLPASVQRTLSFLPGKWDDSASRDARGSTEWRWQMWKLALTEDRWIQNKLLGDGFGLTKYDLAVMQSLRSFSESQENFLLIGQYHSGPISTIRYVGMVGLALFIPMMGLIIIRAVRLIRVCIGTALFPAALFVGMPLIFYPIPFIFVAGGFDTSFTELLFSAGMIRMLSRTADTMRAQATIVSSAGGVALPSVGAKRRRLQPISASEVS